VQGYVCIKVVAKLVTEMQLIMVLLVIVGLIVVVMFVSVAVVIFAKFVVGSVCVDYVGRNTVPCLICFFFARESYSFYYIFFAQISSGKVKRTKVGRSPVDKTVR